MIKGSQAGNTPARLSPWPAWCAMTAALVLGITLLGGAFQACLGATDVPPGGELKQPSPAVGKMAPDTEEVEAGVPPLLGNGKRPDMVNPPVSPASAEETVKLVTNALAVNLNQFFAATNGLPRSKMSPDELLMHLTRQLETARYLRTTRELRQAEPLLTDLIDEKNPEWIKQSALLELAALAQDDNALSRAQQIYAQFLSKWPEDLRVPEILLRQGLLFRQMGMYTLAFTKFYSVMTSALVMKNDQLEYYVRLVLQAQTEIAETQYELGKYADAADFFGRLLKQNNPAINKAQIMYKLVRCQAAQKQFAEVVSMAEDYLARYPEAPEQPEIRFYLAQGLKELGRNAESLQQVLLLLQEQREQTKGHPGLWIYWQQRAGNLIANQLYREGDYPKALEIYLNLALIDPSPQWQLPVYYQVGMTYERLWQPQKATDVYNSILKRESEVGNNPSPGLKTVFDMARWRIGFIQWQSKAEDANHQLHYSSLTNESVASGIPQIPAATP